MRSDWLRGRRSYSPWIPKWGETKPVHTINGFLVFFSHFACTFFTSLLAKTITLVTLYYLLKTDKICNLVNCKKCGKNCAPSQSSLMTSALSVGSNMSLLCDRWYDLVRFSEVVSSSVKTERAWKEIFVRFRYSRQRSLPVSWPMKILHFAPWSRKTPANRNCSPLWRSAGMMILTEGLILIRSWIGSVKSWAGKLTLSSHTHSLLSIPENGFRTVSHFSWNFSDWASAFDGCLATWLAKKSKLRLSHDLTSLTPMLLQLYFFRELWHPRSLKIAWPARNPCSRLEERVSCQFYGHRKKNPNLQINERA